jgi:quinol-cytochrome oxidoreductase complex cytochrome b subunit
MELDRKNPSKTGLLTRIWRSIFVGPVVPRTDRERKWVVFNTLVLHLRPIHVPKATIRFTHTFGLGGMSLVLILLLMGTGILLMFAYEPSPDRAYESIVGMQDEILFGPLVRAVHHWSANLLVLVVLLHMLRVFLTGGFHGARQFNWIIGLVLLFLVLASNFTGYLLPWDQLSYWAVTICTAMIGYIPQVGEWMQGVIRGGPEIGRATLIGFYTLHTSVMPVLLIVLMAWHFWRVRKAKGVVIPQVPGEDLEAPTEKVLFLPNLLLRETVVALVLVALVLVIASLFAAPLGQPANPGMSPNPAKAPWYFLGFQELLLHFHPVIAILVLPMMAVLALLALPYLRYEPELAGNWFLSPLGKRMAAVSAVAAFVIAPVCVVLDEFVDFPVFLPFIVVLVVVSGFYAVIHRWFKASRNETVQALFIFLTVAFTVLTVIGIWFRGAGMGLVWPWNL